MKHQKIAAIACSVVLAATLSACSGVVTASGENKITLMQPPGYDDTAAVTALWTVLLEERDYSVETVSVDLVAGFAGIARGDMDVYLNAWLPTTHGTFLEEFTDNVEILDDNGPFFDDNRLVLAVPKSVEENSIADVAKEPEKFGSKIVGIEAGAGMMTLLPGVLEKYGMDKDFKVVDSSTPAALATLEKAVEEKKPVVATLWTPHWAFSAMDIKALEDPEAAWPEPDGSFVVVATDFREQHPDLVKWFENSKLTGEQYAELMYEVNKASDPSDGARTWLEVPENKALVEGWFN